MEENSRLRTLVKDLGGFLGDGLGGPLLSKTGWDMKSFQEMISRADSDTAYEAFVKAKNLTINKNAQSSVGTNLATSPLGETSLDLNGSKKRKRSSLIDGSPTSSNSNPPSPRSPHELPSLLPPRPQAFSAARHADEPPGSFTTLMDTFSSSAGAPYIDMGNPSVGGTRVLPPPAPRDTFGLSPVGMSNGTGGGSSYGGSPYSGYNARDIQPGRESCLHGRLW